MIEKIFDFYYNGAKNIITPNTYEFGYKRFGGEFLLYEKSEGGLCSHEMLGLTFLVLDCEDMSIQRIDLSKPFDNEDDMNDYLESIDVSIFKNAKRCGEIKTLDFAFFVS